MVRKSDLKSAFVGFRLNRNLKRMLLKDSRVAGMSLSEYVCMCCREYERRVAGAGLLPLLLWGELMGVMEPRVYRGDVKGVVGKK